MRSGRNGRHFVAGRLRRLAMDLHRHRRRRQRASRPTASTCSRFRDGKIHIKNVFRKARPNLPPRAEVGRADHDSATSALSAPATCRPTSATTRATTRWSPPTPARAAPTRRATGSPPQARRQTTTARSARDIDADVVVIGSGATGMSTALYLARSMACRPRCSRPTRLSWGCSSRSGGQGQNASGRLKRSQWIERWGIDVARRLDAEIRTGFEHFRRLTR